MALNPIAYTEKVVSSFLRYQLTRAAFADADLYRQMRGLLSLEATRETPLLKGPYISLSRAFREGAGVKRLVSEGILHPFMENLIPHAHVYGHQEKAIRAVLSGNTTLVSTGTGSGKTECFLYPVISRCLQLREEGAPPGIVAVLIYPMNALAEDQLGRLRGLLAGTGITFGMYVGKTPVRSADVTGQRLEAGSSNADYQAAFEKAKQERRGTAVHPPEERSSREEMRAPGEQPRILITNVKQLELLLTRHSDVELFDGASLEFLVCDEAHTFSGAIGAETACLIRRLRAFCGGGIEDTTCVATSATIADPDEGIDAGRDFATRFFGIPRERVTIVGEEYAAESWGVARMPVALKGEPAAHLQTVLQAMDGEEIDAESIRKLYQGMTGTALSGGTWEEAVFDTLGSNETVYQIAQALEHPRPLAELVEALSETLSRAISEEEILIWLTLGATARKEERPLLRPVVHAFVRGVGGAVVTFPEESQRPRLWLSAEDEQSAREDDHRLRLPILNCNTCGQHYFVHHLEDFRYTNGTLGGGHAVGDRSYWQAQDPNLGGQRLVLLNRLISAADDEDDTVPNTETLFICRSCGAAHPTNRDACDGCGVTGALVPLAVAPQNAVHPGYLTRCLSCSAMGRTWATGYREPARPVRAVAVADVHVLAQDMVHHAERRRLLVFADNRQDAAFQAGWMRDHARRFRLRALMAERIRDGAVSIGDLSSWLDGELETDEELSRVLIPEVWETYRREDAGVEHQRERKRFLRIQILRELTMGVKQPIGLEPWGRMRVQYLGLSADVPFVVEKAAELGVPANVMADGIGALLDWMRRSWRLLYDREGNIYSRFWQDGDREVLQGYIQKIPGVPKGLKLIRDGGDDTGRVAQWISNTGHLTSARAIARSWGVLPDDTDDFLRSLWEFLTEDAQILVPVTLRGARGNALPRCSGTYQVDADKMRLSPIRELYRCNTCRRAQVRPTPHDRCIAWRCDGTLVFEPENTDSYDLALLDQKFEMIRPHEHSAQVPIDRRDWLERQFKGSGELINTLVCTPTLELGVDIGELDTVLLRNVPPLPANYWQRVGRAGRRHRMAVNFTYARPASHDQVYFSDPTKMLGGRVEPPRFNLRNELMVKKHVHAAILTRLHELSREHSGLSEYDRNEVSETLAKAYPVRITGYLFHDNGDLRSEAFDVSPLRTLISKHADDLTGHATSTFTAGWPEDSREVVDDKVIRAHVAATPDALEEVIRLFRKRLNWARGQMERLERERARRATLDAAEDALYQRCDRLVKRLKGQRYRQRREAEGIDDINTYAALAAEGYLPGYGLEIGSVVATAQMPRHLIDSRDFDLRRPSTLAVREYVPGNLLYANGQRFFPRFYHLEPEEPSYFQVDLAHDAIRETSPATEGGTAGGLAQTAGLSSTTVRAVPICDLDLPHFSHISDDEEFRFQMGVAVLGQEKGRWNGGTAYQWGGRQLLHRRGVHFRIVNIGASRLIDSDTPRVGYPVCLVCGQSRSPFASTRELDQFRDDHQERCGKLVEATGFYADIVADAISLPGCANREEAYSTLEAIRTGAARVLDMETGDLDILVIGRPGVDEVDGILFDPMPGGSGLLDQIYARFEEVIAAAGDLVANCPSDCARACVDCLMRFRNAFFHKHLNRQLAAEKFQAWGANITETHPIPPNLPAVELKPDELPVNDAETALRSMLQGAGLPEPEWHKQINLGRPLGTTSPDCYFEDEEPEEPGLCVYLDGLSRHIHGNPETFQRDREIREELRSRQYEVIEIAASDLYDQDKMTRHLFRIARYLVGKDQAKLIRKQPDWYVSPAGR